LLSSVITGCAAHEEELVSGEIDAAVVTLPVNYPLLSIEVIRRDRLVVCLRRDHPFASKAIFQTSDLHGNLTILYHPERHFDAHQRARECLREIGIDVENYGFPSHDELRACPSFSVGRSFVTILITRLRPRRCDCSCVLADPVQTSLDKVQSAVVAR
jgi:DNA-binding transcriptional LysR family regulator